MVDGLTKTSLGGPPKQEYWVVKTTSQEAYFQLIVQYLVPGRCLQMLANKQMNGYRNW